MSVNTKEKDFELFTADMDFSDESAYSPTIRELTPQQLRNLKIKKSLLIQRDSPLWWTL